ncbi:restriction endonuclease [Microbacterium aureliae]
MIFTWQMAEELAAAHLRGLGFRDARRTGSGADGGIDVTGSGVAAQVKHLSRPVGGPDVQRLRGAAYRSVSAAFYASSGYTEAAIRAAAATGVALFRFTNSNDVLPVNAEAVEWCSGADKAATLKVLGAAAHDRMEQLRGLHSTVHPRVGAWAKAAREIESEAVELLSREPSNEQAEAMEERLRKVLIINAKAREVRVAQEAALHSINDLAAVFGSVPEGDIAATFVWLSKVDMIGIAAKLEAMEEAVARYEFGLQSFAEHGEP